jgi:ATP-dependent helicase/DNAse subunit B
MQLPVYLYLTKNYIKDAEIVGFYLQQILFNKFSKDNNKTLKELKINNSKLKGYSIGNEDKLSMFDSSYINSELIHSMKVTSKGFGTYSKVVSGETVDEMIEFTKNKIDKVSDDILDSKFDINPKFYDKENISCKFCNFQDICYMKNNDLKYLTKVDNFDFLGGEE